ncbi:MAG: hypothetical protein ACOX3S_10225 [Anaerolineae bacterium]|jgi:hypothetical protein
MPLHNGWPRRASAGSFLQGLLGAALLVALVACAAAPDRGAGEPLRLTLVHSNDTMGMMSPCG